MEDNITPTLRPRWRWFLMRLAKRTGGWDLWLGQKWGWELDEGSKFESTHWHFKGCLYVVHREEY